MLLFKAFLSARRPFCLKLFHKHSGQTAINGISLILLLAWACLLPACQPYQLLRGDSKLIPQDSQWFSNEDDLALLMWADLHHQQGIVMNTQDSDRNLHYITQAMYLYDRFSQQGMEALLASQRAAELASYVGNKAVAMRSVRRFIELSQVDRNAQQSLNNQFFKANFYGVLLGFIFADKELILESWRNIDRSGEDLLLHQDQLANWLANTPLSSQQRQQLMMALVSASSSHLWIDIFFSSLDIEKTEQMQLAEQLLSEERLANFLDNQYLLVKFAEYYQNSGQKNKAIVFYEKMLKLPSMATLNEVTAHHKLASLYGQSGDFKNAIKHLKWLQLYVPRLRDWAYFYAGVLSFQATKYPQALSYLKEVQSNTHERYALYYQAYSHLRLSQLQLAIEYLDDLLIKFGHEIEYNRDFLSDVLLLRSDILVANSQIPKAIELLVSYPDDYWVNASVRYRLAMLYVQQQDYLSAEKVLRQLIESDYQTAEVLNALGYILTDQLDQHQEALELLLKANQLAPDQAHILDSLGWAYFNLGRYQQSLNYLQRAVAIQASAEISYHYIQALRRLGRVTEAQAFLHKQLKEHPEDATLQALKLPLLPQKSL